MLGRQPNAPAAFTPGEIPGTHFQRLSRPQDTWFCRWEPWKKSLVTPPGIDPGTVRIVAQCLNHYATPGPNLITQTTFNNKSTYYKNVLDLNHINFSYSSTRWGLLDHLKRRYCNHNYKFLSFNYIGFHTNG